jgi:peptidyl-prolyl cis-trans isomerase D
MVILFGLLILSFAVWGIGDIFRPGVRGTAAIVTVGEMEITADQYRRELSRIIQQRQKLLGITLSNDQARRMGIADQVLRGMIRERLLAQGVNDVGILVSTELVARDIRPYRIEIEAQGLEAKALDVELGMSLYVGIIELSSTG